MTYSSNIELRDYQKECLASIPEQGSFLIQMATGLGKTVTFSNIPFRTRMLILSHREELVIQPKKYFKCSFGIEQGKYTQNGEQVVSASIQSIVRRLNRYNSDDFDVIVVDEAHHAAAKNYRKVLDYFNPRLVLGFTATPNRGDKVRLDDIFEKIIFKRDLKWGIQNGYLCNIYCLRVNIGYSLSNVAKSMGDYKLNELDRAVNQNYMNTAVAEAYYKYAKGQTIIFAISVDHAEKIASLIDGAVVVSGNTKNREEIIEKFKEEEIKVLVNCMIFTEGTDIPNIETIIIARPTKSNTLYTQMVGRGLRLYPGKKKCVLIDCVGTSSSADLCTAPTLIGVDMDQVPRNKQDEVIGDLFDLPKIITEKSDVPSSWIKNVELVDLWSKEQKYDTHGVFYFKMPNGDLLLDFKWHDKQVKLVLPAQDELGNTVYNGQTISMQEALDKVYLKLNEVYHESKSLWDLNVIKKWGNYQATDKQKELIKKLNVDIDTEYITKIEASQILKRKFYICTRC